MNVYMTLAHKLLLMENHTFFQSPKSGRFGFDLKRNYSGLMAKPSNGKSKIRRKQGLFDITIDTGNRYGTGVTHRHLFVDLMDCSTENQCLKVWKGEDPRIIGNNDDEREALTTMALLMFEQEVNWGKNDWQRFSYFTPLSRNPSKRRPRDMIMGYIRQAFDLGIDNMKYWMTSKPGTIWFYDREESPYRYETYPDNYKKYFLELESMGGTEAVMCGDILKEFEELAEKYPNHPLYED